MKDGVYVTIRRDGLALVTHVWRGRLVEAMCVQSGERPKRRTTRRIGDTILSVLQERERQRVERMLRLLMEAG